MIPKKTDNKKYKKNLVGKEAIIKTKDKSFEGKIILETKNTIKIITKEGTKTLIKKNSTLIVDNQEIKGEEITKRTEDRIKTR